MHFGGSFAPPLTDAALADYRAQIAALPAQSQVRDAMNKLLACCEAWWELPDSAGTETRAHPSGRGTIVALEVAHQDALWDHIPWRDELDQFAALFDGIEVGECARNGQKIRAWRDVVTQAIRSAYFPEPGLYERVVSAARTAAEWLALGLFSKDVEAKIIQHQDAVAACYEEITEAFRTKSHPAVPYPALEPTLLRYAAHHLLWHVVELERDREPLTTDKL